MIQKDTLFITLYITNSIYNVISYIFSQVHKSIYKFKDLNLERNQSLINDILISQLIKNKLIKTKFNISDDQTNIDKYRLAPNITECHIILSTISNLESHRISKSKKKNQSNRSINKKLDFCGPVSHLRESTISDLESPSNFQVKEEKIIQIGP